MEVNGQTIAVLQHTLVNDSSILLMLLEAVAG